MAEDEMVGWHHQLSGYEFEQALRVGDGQGRLVSQSDTTERLNKTELNKYIHFRTQVPLDG